VLASALALIPRDIRRLRADQLAGPAAVESGEPLLAGTAS
jgi:hypothetical protein